MFVVGWGVFKKEVSEIMIYSFRVVWNKYAINQSNTRITHTGRHISDVESLKNDMVWNCNSQSNR